MRQKPGSQWLLIITALAMFVLAVVIVLDRSAQRLGLLDRAFAWLAAKAGSGHVRGAAIESPLALGLLAGAAVLALVVVFRAVRK